MGTSFPSSNKEKGAKGNAGTNPLKNTQILTKGTERLKMIKLRIKLKMIGLRIKRTRLAASNPNGIASPAQGCEERATLGWSNDRVRTLKGESHLLKPKATQPCKRHVPRRGLPRRGLPRRFTPKRFTPKRFTPKGLFIPAQGNALGS